VTSRKAADDLNQKSLYSVKDAQTFSARKPAQHYSVHPKTGYGGKAA